MHETGGEQGGAVGVVGSTTQGTRLERSARFWMRAYPRRWRVARGQELLGVLFDLAAPGATGVGARTAFDLLRGGWATRWREHPPFGAWVAYRVINRTLPRQYRAWAKDDIDGIWFALRQAISTWWFWFYLVFYSTSSRPGARALFALVLISPLLAVFATTFGDRRRQLLKHVAPQRGERLYDGGLVVQDGPRMRTDARSGLRWLAAASGVLAAGSFVTIAVAPLGWWVHQVQRGPGVDGGLASGFGPVVYRGPALAVLLVGGIAAVVAVRRVRRWLPLPVEQPFRVLFPIGLLGAARTLIVIAIGAVPLWFELTGRLVMLVSPLLGAVTVVLLATAVTGLAHTRRPGAPPVAVVDVLRVALLNRAPQEDGPVPELGPVGCSVPYDGVLPPAFGAPRYPVSPA